MTNQHQYRICLDLFQSMVSKYRGRGLNSDGLACIMGNIMNDYRCSFKKQAGGRPTDGGIGEGLGAATAVAFPTGGGI